MRPATDIPALTFYRTRRVFVKYYGNGVVSHIEGRVAWQGTVEVFDLLCHEKAKRAYAWQYYDSGQTKTVAILEIPPVDSPESAVKVAIAARGRVS